MANEPGNLLIVGAGFSFNAGLPLASDFTRELLDVGRLKLDGPSNGLVKYIRHFVDTAFGEGKSRSAKQWPELEDMFTLLDLSANTGHHLGPHYSAADLRVVRRAIIVRMIRMLSQTYKRRQRSPDDNWQLLETLFRDFDGETTAVLSMNWDTVFEQGLARTQSVRNIDYGCSARPHTFERGKLKRRVTSGDAARILKPHGSVNWLYCDACRETVWVPPSESLKVASTLFRTRDWQTLLGGKVPSSVETLSPPCPNCEANALGTRFATFSYRKALDFPMHAASWRTAEIYLKKSVDWVFFGYSMPSADFEFKHLLKRVQLTESERPRITVITGGTDADATVERFYRFFGRVPKERWDFRDGLTSEVIQHLRDIEVLRPV
ncbi:hypothetical protein [Novosphingobium album (ex Liu et al. 2023)]|uniref:Deacetylase sirtuin-type domain-containing protein n=1 Tax=Novosphingobium album (ex Liu et al. 2023) TaxID=3031130 RepID=A0ABT5WXG7_9SPHN|nr:hypothetical protein [Novosphingobium album (ex Liu et al. 2023)]MDE8654554.1 hypothetical protein [Novosphingobium album (ex Liu et al. 2023)]